MKRGMPISSLRQKVAQLQREFITQIGRKWRSIEINIHMITQNPAYYPHAALCYRNLAPP
jgi:hypothetical protein